MDKATYQETTEEKACRQANEDIIKQGYFIIASVYVYRIKELVPYTKSIHHPVIVIGNATEEEFIDQVVRWNSDRTDAAEVALKINRLQYYRFFYKVTAE